MKTRDEVVNDLVVRDQTSLGNPSEEGTVRNVSNDLVVYIGGTVKSLTSGAGLSEGGHESLRQLIHFLDNGPGYGFGAGVNYEETTYSGAFPTSSIWYEDSTKAKKIFSWEGTWSGVKLTQETHKIYDSDGSTVLAQAVDVMTYSGIFETNRTRTITVP
jgi:hypothetical protein